MMIAERNEFNFNIILKKFEKNFLSKKSLIDKKYLNLKSDFPFLSKIELDNEDDKDFVISALKSFSLDLEYITKIKKDEIDYYFNCKIIYYSLRIIENLNFSSEKLKNKNIKNIFNDCLNLSEKY